MERISLVALIGLPAVGKTTFSKALMKLESSFNILHLCYDNYITFNPETTLQYKEQRAYLLKFLETIVQDFKSSKTLPSNLINGKTVKFHYNNLNHKDLLIICDDNHYYHSMRYKLYQLARQYHIGYGQIYLECPYEIALQRNNSRLDFTKVPEEIFLQMRERLEPPNILTHIWEKNTIIVTQKNLQENNFLVAVSFIMKLFEVPIEPLEPLTQKTVTTQSIVHNLDLLMRKRISHLITSSVGISKKLLAEELNGKRKTILKEFELKIQQFECVQDEQDFNLNKYIEML